MVATIRNATLRLISRLFPEGTCNSLLGRFCKPLMDQLDGKITNDFLELLLRGMELSFCLSKSYREDIKDFKGTYVFRTQDGQVGCSAVFRGGHMDVENKVKSPYEVRVSFKDAQAIWRFLLGENQDILNSILANDVDVDGNLNYVYKFGYLARDLQHRLSVA